MKNNTRSKVGAQAKTHSRGAKAGAKSQTVAPILGASVRKDVATFRRLLVGAFSDFLKAEEMSCPHTQDGLIDLAVQLSRYREEGLPLYPRFVLCDDLPATLKLVRGTQQIQLGRDTKSAATVRLALKKCAPLARADWVGYIHRENDAFSFGVFHETASPTAVSMRDTVRVGTPARLIYVTQLAENVVELVGATGAELTVHLSAVPETQPSPLTDMNDLVAEAIADVPKHREQCASFLRSSLTDALRRGHGTILAVVDAKKSLPQALSDAVELTTPLSIQKAVADYIASPDDASQLTKLKSYDSLLEGMLSSDGITVLRSDGQILAFNAFVKDPEANAQKPSAVHGGARRRAFTALKKLIAKNQLRAAFMRSSDGGSDFKKR